MPSVQEVEACLVGLESQLVKLKAARASTVRYQKAETEIIGKIEQSRDIMMASLQDTTDKDRTRLSEAFGGDRHRIAKFRSVLEAITLSDRYASDHRLSSSLNAVSLIENRLAAQDLLVGIMGCASHLAATPGPTPSSAAASTAVVPAPAPNSTLETVVISEGEKHVNDNDEKRIMVEISVGVQSQVDPEQNGRIVVTLPSIKLKLDTHTGSLGHSASVHGHSGSLGQGERVTAGTSLNGGHSDSLGHSASVNGGQRGSVVHGASAHGSSLGPSASVNVGHSGSSTHSASIQGGQSRSMSLGEGDCGGGGHSPHIHGGTGETVDAQLPAATTSAEEHFPGEMKGARLPPITIIWTTPTTTPLTTPRTIATPLQHTRTFDHEPCIVQGCLPPNHHDLITSHPLSSPASHRTLPSQGHGHCSQHDCNLIAAGHNLVSPTTFRFYKDPQYSPENREATDPLAFQFGTRDVPNATLGNACIIDASRIESQIQEVAAAQERFMEELEEVKHLANSNTHDLSIWKRSRRLEDPVIKPRGSIAPSLEPTSREPFMQSSRGRSLTSRTAVNINGSPAMNLMGNKHKSAGTHGQRSLTARNAHGLHRAARTHGHHSAAWTHRLPSGKTSKIPNMRDEANDNCWRCI